MRKPVWCGIVFLFFALAVAPWAAAETLTLKLVHNHAPGTIWQEVAEDYASRVHQRSGGKVKIEVVHADANGVALTAEDLLAGDHDIMMHPVGALSRYDALAGLEAYPYLIRDIAHFRAVYDGALGKELLTEIGKRTAFHLIGAAYRGTHHLSSNRLVEKIDDLRDLKVRVPELKIFELTWEYLGASPVPMDFSELYEALREEDVMAQESPLKTMRDANLSEVQKYVIETGHILGAMTFILPDDRYWALPEDVRQLLQEEGEAAMRAGTDRMIQMEPRYRKDLETRGMTFIPVNRNAFQAKLAPMAKEFEELTPWIQRIKAAIPPAAN
jgi:TRAP-type C4-dicarboxylate transport system substrate-binding protein|nr:MAG: TRAP transporter substrate-binding protein DctP [Pseudomonadota bacterium]